MNYANYKRKIVELFVVALVGWPLDGHVRNPGALSSKDDNMLRDALSHKVCKWTLLTPEEVAAWQIDNQYREANGEQVYGPTWKQRACNVASTNGSGDSGEGNNGTDVSMDVDIPSPWVTSCVEVQFSFLSLIFF